MGNGEVIDSMINDGLWCAFENCHMGMSGEVVAERYGVSRADQDAYAVESHRKAAHARREGWFADEIAPGPVPQKKGPAIVVDRDEAIREDTSPETLAALKPAFKAGGTRYRRQCARRQRRRRRSGPHVGRQGACARPHAARPHRWPGNDGSCAEDGADDAGRSGAQGCSQGRLDGSRTSTCSRSTRRSPSRRSP